jgi:uncharacterized protein
MRFDVGPLLRESVGSTRTYQLEKEQVSTSEDGFDAQVAGTVVLLRTRGGILVTAHLGISIADRCSRCLAPLGVSFGLDFHEEYAPTVDIHTGSQLPSPDDRDSFLIDDQQTLDLSEAIRQYQLAAQPMQLLCRTDCKGLCPDCGHNLNLGPCSCRPEPADSRWLTLARLSDVRGKLSDSEGGD